MLKIIPLLAAAVLALPVPMLAQDTRARCCGSSKPRIRL